MKRITILAAAGALVATPALGAWAAFASTDDGSGRAPAQVRVDDRRHHGEIEPGDDHGRHHHRHGADDAAGHVRHSGEAEPVDDRGGRGGEIEPGDDHGDDDGSGSEDSGRHGGHGSDDGPGHH